MRSGHVLLIEEDETFSETTETLIPLTNLPVIPEEYAEPEIVPWVTPKLIPIGNARQSMNSLTGTGDVDATYSGFPYGYS